MINTKYEKLKKVAQLYLTEDDLLLIVLKALVKARKLQNKLDESSKIHIAIAGRGKNYAAIVHTDDKNDNRGRTNVQNRALSALNYSSDEKAMSSHSVKKMLEKNNLAGEKLDAGGFPLYKNHDGESYLVGSVAIASTLDNPQFDEEIALAASEDFSAPSHKRSDVLMSLPYISKSAQSTQTFPYEPSRFPTSPKVIETLSEGGVITPNIPLSNESPLLRSDIPLEVSSEIIVNLPPLPTKSSILNQPIFPSTSLPPLSPSKASSLPPLSPSKASSLPPLSPSKASSLPPLSPSKASSLPPLSPSKASSLPPLSPSKTGSLPPLSPSKAGSLPPLSPSKASSLPPLSPSKASSLPPLSPSKAGSLPPLSPEISPSRSTSLEKIRTTETKTGVPVLPLSPPTLKNKTALPPLSKLVPMK
jgi:hypothetical protein